MPDTLDPAVERELAALDAALAGAPGADPVLTELTALVREERPVPTPRWADALDERLAAGFPRARRRGPRLRIRMLPAVAALATVFLAVVIGASVLRESAVVGVDGGGGSAGGMAATEQSARSSGAGAAADSAGSFAQPPGATGDDADRVRPRRVELTAYLTLAAPGEELGRLGDRIIALTDRLGGFVQSSSVESGEMGGGGTFELRVPANRLDRALADLSRLAHVRERMQSSQDITAETVDAAERLTDLRAERRALRRALDAAGTTREAARARAALRRVAREIAGAERALRDVRARAEYATVQIALVADDEAGAGAPGDGRWTPGEALDDAIRVLEAMLAAALIVLAVALPLGAVVAVALLARRWMLTRRRAGAADAA